MRFSEVIDSVQFDFVSMNVKEPQLYQVYVNYDGQQYRFHMQINDSGAFKITDERNCPHSYKELTPELNAAIFHHL